MKRKEKKKLPFLARLLIVMIVLFTIIASSAILSETFSETGTTANNTDTAIVDNDAMSVYYVGAQDASSLGVFYVTLKIENKTDSVIFVNLENASVDGETIPLITTGAPLVIQPGNSGRTGFIFSMVNLSISSMDEAEKATFQVVIRNNDTFAEISRSEMVTVELH